MASYAIIIMRYPDGEISKPEKVVRIALRTEYRIDADIPEWVKEEVDRDAVIEVSEA